MRKYSALSFASGRPKIYRSGLITKPFIIPVGLLRDNFLPYDMHKDLLLADIDQCNIKIWKENTRICTEHGAMESIVSKC